MNFPFDKVDNMRMWVHRVLPLVYDDSLSYAETLWKVVKKLNEVIDLTDEQSQYIVSKISELENAWNTWKTQMNEDINLWESESYLRLEEQVSRTLQDAIVTLNDTFVSLTERAEAAQGAAEDAQEAAETAQGHAEDAADHCDDVLESIPEDYSTLSNDVADLKSAIDEISSKTENIFDMSVFDGVEGITKDANGYYTGTGQAFKNAFGYPLSVPGISFETNSQYFLSAEAYTDGNSSTAENNGLQFSFYASNPSEISDHIGRMSFLNSTTTLTKKSKFSTEGASVAYLSIGASSSILNIWHIKNIMLCKSSIEVDYIPNITANDAVARKNILDTVYSIDITGKSTNGAYINTANKLVGDTIDLTPVSNSGMIYYIGDCNKGDCFVVTATGLSNATKPWVFVNTTNVVTKIPDKDSLVYTDYSIIAPEDGKIVINAAKASTYKLIKISNAQIATAVDDANFAREAKIASRWRGKKIVTFGDSRTWYDRHSYTENCKPELLGTVCVGYQQQMRNLMMATVDNQGASGETSTEICTRIRAFDFTGYDAVFLEGGVNDFVKSNQVTIGEIAAIGSTFDTTTVYGAWQSAVEYILTNYPSVLIYMDIPPIAWIHQADDVFPYDIAKIKGNVAALYNIPCLDLYKTAGINVVNRDYWYCDNVESTYWRLHFNDYGNALIGAKIAEFMICK